MSSRVIQQIANVLQNTKTTNFNKPKNSRYYIVDEMKKNLIDGLKKRIKDEMDLWSDKDQFRKYTETLFHDENFYNRMDEEHGSFAHNSGLDMSVVFLTKKNKTKLDKDSKVTKMVKTSYLNMKSETILHRWKMNSRLNMIYVMNLKNKMRFMLKR